MKRTFLLITLALLACVSAFARSRWTPEQANSWYHEVFYGNGRPYRDSESELIRKLTGVSAETPLAQGTGQ